MEKNMMNPLKVYQKGNEKTNSFMKSDGKLNCGEMFFCQEICLETYRGNVRKSFS
jgi:hypothetical protein